MWWESMSMVVYLFNKVQFRQLSKMSCHISPGLYTLIISCLHRSGQVAIPFHVFYSQLKSGRYFYCSCTILLHIDVSSWLRYWVWDANFVEVTSIASLQNVIYNQLDYTWNIMALMSCAFLTINILILLKSQWKLSFTIVWRTLT